MTVETARPEANKRTSSNYELCETDLHDVSENALTKSEYVHPQECGRDMDEAQETRLEEVEVTQETLLEEVKEARLPPLEGGYGWFVVLGCFILHVILGGLDRSEGVFFVMVTERFGYGAQISAWPSAMASTLQLVLGPVANALATRYSVRTIVLAGGIIMSLGLFLNSFATSIYLYFVSHVVIGGVGKGLSYAPGLVILTAYFDRRASLAAGIGTSGVGLGTFVIVPLTQYLADHYGFQGTFMIVSGLGCNLALSAMLYRPLSLHYKFTKSSERKKESEAHKQPISNDKRNGLIRDVQKRHLSPEDVEQASAEHRKRHKTNCGCLLSSLKICFPVEKHSQGSKSSNKLFNFSLLKNLPFLLCCLSIALFAMSFRAALTFIPSLVQSKGISKSDAALALSVTGAVDSVGRLAAGVLLDRPSFRPFRLLLYNACIFGVATAVFILPILNDFASYTVVCATYGLMTGAFVSQKSVVLLDILGAEHLASSFGIYLCFQGFGNLLGPPLAGGLKDSLGTFDKSFYLCGGLLIISGLLLVTCNILLATEKRQTERTEMVIDPEE